MKHYIDENNIYHLIVDNIEVMSIKLDEEYKAVHIETDNQVFEGPIQLLNICDDKDLHKKD